MKKAIQITGGAIVIYVVLIFTTGLAAKALLSSDRIQNVLSSLETDSPVRISASGGDFDLGQWFLFRPSVTIRDLSVSNPPGFSQQPLLDARSVSAQIALPSLLHGRTDIRRIALQEPQLSVETGPNGRTNLEILLASLRERNGSAAGASASNKSAPAVFSIATFSLQSGAIRFMNQSQRQPALTIRDLDVVLTDFAPDASCNIRAGARLFGGKTSRFDFTGRAGPFREDSTPAQGVLSVKLAPAEAPAALRVAYFGDLMRDPGERSRMTLEAAMQGDLMRTLEGQGKLALENFEVGKDRASRIPLRGTAPLRLAVERALSNPAFSLEAQGALLQLGDGRWKGGVAARFDGSRLSGSSKGAITGVQIRQMLAAFTSMGDKVSGMAEIPIYQISFAGRNAEEMRDSLNGAGNITLEKGRFALFDLLNTVEQVVKRASRGDQPASGSTDFTTFQSSFRIANRQVNLPDLVLENGASRIAGQGYFTFLGEIGFDLVTNVTGELAASLGGRPDSSGRAQFQVPVKVRGSLESPKVYPDVGRLAVQTATEKAAGLLDRFLNKKKPPQ
jgi:uncharacterized protein involved in outer membrane biogenesis